MALPMYDQPSPRLSPTLVSSSPSPQHHPAEALRSPSAGYWFRRVLAAAILLLFLWISSLLAAEFRWAWASDDPAVLSRPAPASVSPAYVIVGDTALPVIDSVK